MPIVPVIPVVGVPQKPTTPKLTQGANLAIGYPFNEGVGLPKDILDRLNPVNPPSIGGWDATTPWGSGYRIEQGPFRLGALDLQPPLTYHVLFKPDFLPVGSPTKEALIFGEIDGSGNVIDGVGLKWGTAEDTAFAYGVYGGQSYYSYTQVQPQDHQWYSVSFAYDGQSATIFVNGAPTVAAIAIPLTNTGTKQWVLGGSGFSGIVADARVYQRVLSASEIYNLSSSPAMWNDYAGIEKNTSDHSWRRQIWRTPVGTFRVARRVAKIARR